MDISVRLAQAACQAALAVGPYLRSAFAQEKTVSFKVDFHDPVTAHDHRAQELIVASLLSSFPDSLVVGEESEHLIAHPDSSRRPTSAEITDDDIVWYVDPIDGTSNFAAGFNHWCVSIAASQAGRVIAAAIYQPTVDIMYYADSTGAYKNGSPIKVNSLPAHQGVVATEYPSPWLDDTEAAMRGFLHVLHSVRSVRRTGSTALMLAEVAAGSFVGTFNVGARSWDVAAGAFLVLRAGGVYVGWEGEKVYERNAVEAPNFVAAGSEEVTRLCLEASGNPDPSKTARWAWEYFGPHGNNSGAASEVHGERP